MPSTFGTDVVVFGLNAGIVPYHSGIPGQLRQGDSALWFDQPLVDHNGTTYDSTGYTLKYTLAGPTQAPLVLTAAVNGVGWQTTLTPTASAGLLPGTYSWQAQLSATNVRITIDQGELLVLPDLASVGANYDGRSLAEIALAQAKAAFSTFSQTGGRVRSYTIGHRSMSFDNLMDVKAQVDFWKKEVAAERLAARGGQNRTLHLRFNRTR